jgi:hypothetical protein
MKQLCCAFLVGISTLVVAGCTTAPTRLEVGYWMALRSAKVHQTLHPEVGKDGQPVEDLNGSAAQAVVERYRESFAKPPPPPAFILSTGSAR